MALIRKEATRQSAKKEKTMKNTNNKMKKLTQKMLLFIDKYFELNFNGTEAYLQAYPAVRKRATAKVNASRLLTNANVKAEVESRQKEAREVSKELVDQIREELSYVAFSRITNYLTFGPGGVILKSSIGMTPEIEAAIDEVSENVTQAGSSVKFKLSPKLKALELLMRHYGLITEKTEDVGKGGNQEGMVDFGQIMADIAAGYKPGKLWNYGDMAPETEE